MKETQEDSRPCKEHRDAEDANKPRVGHRRGLERCLYLIEDHMGS